MKLYKSGDQALLEISSNEWKIIEDRDWDELINRTDLFNYLKANAEGWKAIDAPIDKRWNAPLVSQEVWAAGVTYLRSKVARMAEAEEAGGGDFYDRVYDADRPEIFFKATAARTVGDGEEVYIRKDSTWDVPEPELALFCSSQGTIEGYTIGNDMSSRSIEGENPLYLPQAKTYEKCAALGPCIYLREDPIPANTTIKMKIVRGAQEMYSDQVALSQMKRKLPDLVEYLFRECNFPLGVFLMTGTCLVPEDHFTLAIGDKIQMEIDHIGKLENYVGKRI